MNANNNADSRNIIEANALDKENIHDFLYHEARLLDEGRFSDWLELWMPDGIYWMPLDYQQTDPDLVTSLMYEDMFMLKLRVERLNGARTFSQKPKSRCSHVLQRPWIDEIDNSQCTTTTSMHYVETRQDDQILLAITATHKLVLHEGKLRIANKRVDLLNCDAAFGSIQLLP